MNNRTDNSEIENRNQTCPGCDNKGKIVKPITLRSILTEEAQAVADLEGFRFCRTPRCDVAYYRDGGDTFMISDVRVPIGQKQTDASRTICYCFEHTAGEIERDVKATGSSAIPEAIAAKCKQGLDRCPETNPQGSCCLGNVKAALKEAQEIFGVRDDQREAAAATASCCDASNEDAGGQEDHDCCGQPVSTKVGKNGLGRGGLLATSGAVLAAILSSACCWLPLLLIAFGASAAGVAGFFEQYRFVFLGVTVVLLAGAFYLVYRKPRCAPRETCAVPNTRLRKFNKGMIWVATLIVIAFAVFPNYVGVLIGGGSNGGDISSTAAPDRTIRIEGMTCDGCTANLELQIAKLPGVARAEVSFADKTAEVYFMTDVPARPTEEELQSQITAAGFKGIPVSGDRTVHIAVGGMTCEGCAAGLVERLKSVPGVTSATVNYDAKRAIVVLPTNDNIEPVLDAIRKEGFEAGPAAPNHKE